MNDILLYTLSSIDAKLENLIQHSCPDKEDNMPLNIKKIRRHVYVNGRQVWVCADSEQEYADKLISLAGRYSPVSSHNFREYAERWFEVFARPNVAQVTALTYRRQLDNYILPVIGDKSVETVEASDLQMIFNSMGDHVCTATKAKVKIVLNQIFKMAVDDHIIGVNPMNSSSIRVKGQISATTEPYTLEQMRYLAAHLNDISREIDRAWLALSLALPLRPEEVLGLKWEDIDVPNRTVYVRNTVTHPTRNEPEFKPYTKTASSVRSLTFPNDILAYLPEPGAPDEFVIGGESPVTYTQLRQIRKRINWETKFGETIVPRRFRTTVATDISAKTHDLKLVQRMLGHANPQTTLKHYDKGRATSVDASEAIKECYF